MSMELYLLSDRRMSSINEWQNAIDMEGFPLRLPDTATLETTNGFLRSYLRDKLTGFECNYCDPRQVAAEYPRVNFRHDWKYALSLRWLGSKRNEMLAAWMAATAYARATNGMIFDELDGKIHTASEAVKIVSDLESDDQHIVDAAVANALLRLKSRK